MSARALSHNRMILDRFQDLPKAPGSRAKPSGETHKGFGTETCRRKPELGVAGSRHRAAFGPCPVGRLPTPSGHSEDEAEIGQSQMPMSATLPCPTNAGHPERHT